MNLFLSWSGERSKSLAVAVERLLRDLDAEGKVQTHLSTNLAKGGRWEDDLMGDLGASDAVLICLTPEGVASTWITFEAGYVVGRVRQIAGRVDQPKVFTLLYDVSPSDVPDSLSSYQATRVDEDDMRRLMADMIGRPVDPSVWQQAWSGFDTELAGIAPLQLNEVVPDIEQWFRRKTFDEPVHHCLDQSWINRYTGAVETLERLRSVEQQVAVAGRGFAAEVFIGLRAAVDSYATAIRGILLDERSPMPVGATGELRFEIPGELDALEERRKRVKSLLNDGVVLAPFAQPEASFFERLETFRERKDLVHRKRSQLQRDLNDGRLNADMVASWRDSEWAFDRIAAYLVDDMEMLDAGHDVVRAAARELEKAQAIDGKTLMPLHYSLKPVEREAMARRLDEESLKRLLVDVELFMASFDDPEKTRGPDSVVKRIRNRMESEV